MGSRVGFSFLERPASATAVYTIPWGQVAIMTASLATEYCSRVKHEDSRLLIIATSAKLNACLRVSVSRFACSVLRGRQAVCALVFVRGVHLRRW